MASLVIKGIERNIELTRGNKLAAGHPVNLAIIGNSDSKSLEKHIIVYCLGAVRRIEEYGRVLQTVAL